MLEAQTKEHAIFLNNDLIELDHDDQFGYEGLHIKTDRHTGLKTIIAIHNTSRGPAIGGCRCIHYSTINHAIEDVLRLAKQMSYKAAVHHLPHGGGKAVIMKPKEIPNRKAFFEAFGDFVHTFQGKYITAEDSGSRIEDMDVVASRTPYVLGTSHQKGGYGDPSLHTALGVRRGIEAAVYHQLKRSDLAGVRVAIQGVGHVGYHLAKELTALGAKLVVCDMNENLAKRCVEEFSARMVSPEEIYSVDCDVFAPCALGSVINETSIHQLKASIIAGAANNQLAEASLGKKLVEKGILYAPDFVINGGGLIHVSYVYKNGEPSLAKEPILKIYDRLLELFVRAQSENATTHAIAEKIAEENMRRGS